MDPKLVAKISKKVYSRFPEMSGKRPRIKTSKGMPSAEPNFILTYQVTTTGIRGSKIPRHVRVVASPSGKIIKMSTSR